jgi:hypothetical protein
MIRCNATGGLSFQVADCFLAEDSGFHTAAFKFVDRIMNRSIDMARTFVGFVAAYVQPEPGKES